MVTFGLIVIGLVLLGVASALTIRAGIKAAKEMPQVMEDTLSGATTATSIEGAVTGMAGRFGRSGAGWMGRFLRNSVPGAVVGVIGLVLFVVGVVRIFL